VGDGIIARLHRNVWSIFVFSLGFDPGALEFCRPAPATLEIQMPRTEDAADESDSSNATLCGKCSKALQKPLVCARCKTATYCSKDCQVTENGGAWQ
jgi:hypothetical protein